MTALQQIILLSACVLPAQASMPSHITNSRSLHMPHAAETERKQCKEKTRHHAAKTFVALWEATEFHLSLQSSQDFKRRGGSVVKAAPELEWSWVQCLALTVFRAGVFALSVAVTTQAGLAILQVSSTCHKALPNSNFHFVIVWLLPTKPNVCSGGSVWWCHTRSSGTASHVSVSCTWKKNERSDCENTRLLWL